MAVALVDSESVSGSGSGTITLTATGTDRVVIVMCADGNNQASSTYSVTVDTTAPTTLSAYSRVGSVGRQMYILKDTDIIGTEVTVSYSFTAGDTSRVFIAAACFSGVDQTTSTLTADTSGGYSGSTVTNTIGGSDVDTHLVGFGFMRAPSGAIDISGYPNQVPMIRTTGSVYYGDAEAWTYATGGSLGMVLTPTSNEYILDGIQVLPGGISSPVFSDPSGSLTNKVGATVTEDATNWFESSGGSLVFTAITEGTGKLPGGLVMNTSGAISGTLTEAADPSFDCEITVDDDNGQTVSTFTWEILNYELRLTGTKRLINTSASAYVPATTVNFSVVLGTIDGGLTTVVNLGAKAIASGEVTLNNASLTAGTWTVFAQDGTDDTILGVYEIVAE